MESKVMDFLVGWLGGKMPWHDWKKKHVEFISYTVGPGDFRFSTIFFAFLRLFVEWQKISTRYKREKTAILFRICFLSGLISQGFWAKDVKFIVPSFWKPVMLGTYHRKLTKLFGFIAPTLEKHTGITGIYIYIILCHASEKASK